MAADCHIHMVLDGVDWKAAIGRHSCTPDEGFIRQVLETYRQKGYTYLRDGGDRWGVGAKARELAKEYGITYRTPLANLCSAGYYGTFIGAAYENLTQYAQQVKSLRQQGADFIKIMISGLMDFHCYGRLTEAPFDSEKIRQLIHIAHQEGMSVMAHANGARTVETAAAAGVDSVEHGAYLDKDALQAMQDMKTVWVPTASTVGNLLGKGRFPEDQVEKIYHNLLENLSQYKGLVASGTDAGAWAVPHGCGTEQAHLKKAGIGKNRLEAGLLEIQKRF